MLLKYQIRSSWFRRVAKDLPDPRSADVQVFVKASGDLRRNSTFMQDLFELTERTLRFSIPMDLEVGSTRYLPGTAFL